jgi:PKD repeat protein
LIAVPVVCPDFARAAEGDAKVLNPRQERMKATHWRSLRVITAGFAFAGLGALGCGDSNGPGAGNPTANFTSSCVELGCTFTDASNDDGPISSWLWEFGDGQTATTQNPAHNFLASGSYQVKLTVTDGDANTASKSKNVVVTAAGNVAPDAEFDLVCAALRCDFNDNSTDSDGTVDARSWDFGDGSEGSSEVNPVHTYASAGTRTVTLTVTDNSGATKSVSKQAVTTDPVVASLSCVDGTAPGGFVACKLKLTADAGYKVTLVSSSCDAHGNLFRIVEPVVDTLTVDGCYEQAGTEIVRAGPYPAGTDISAEIVAPLLVSPPRLRVTGSYPQWTLEFEDGADGDFNDLVMTVEALP